MRTGRMITLALVALLLIAALAVVVLSGGKEAPDMAGNTENTDILEVKTLLLTRSGSMAWEDAWEIKEIDGQMSLSHYSGDWSFYDGGKMEDCLEKRVALTDEEYAALCGKFQELGVGSWDGFNESDPDVMDGWDFSLEIELADGTAITAHGSNASPEGYHDFFDALTAPLAE